MRPEKPGMFQSGEKFVAFIWATLGSTFVLAGFAYLAIHIAASILD